MVVRGHRKYEFKDFRSTIRGLTQCKLSLPPVHIFITSREDERSLPLIKA